MADMMVDLPGVTLVILILVTAVHFTPVHDKAR